MFTLKKISEKKGTISYKMVEGVAYVLPYLVFLPSVAISDVLWIDSSQYMDVISMIWHLCLNAQYNCCSMCLWLIMFPNLVPLADGTCDSKITILWYFLTIWTILIKIFNCHEPIWLNRILIIAISQPWHQRGVSDLIVPN